MRVSREVNINKIEEQASLLVAESIVSGFNGTSYVEWSVSLLEHGIETDSLFILAGLEGSSMYEIEKYFVLACQELEIDIGDKDRLALLYMKKLAESVVIGTVSIEDGCAMVHKACSEFEVYDYLYEYVEPAHIEWELSTMNDGEVINIDGEEIETLDEYTKEQFRLFLISEENKR